MIDMSLYRRFYRQKHMPFAGAGLRGIGLSSINGQDNAARRVASKSVAVHAAATLRVRRVAADRDVEIAAGENAAACAAAIAHDLALRGAGLLVRQRALQYEEIGRPV